VRGLRFSPPAFTIAFCCTYAIVFAKNWPLFLYYPLHGNFVVWGQPTLKNDGPAMAWYGLMANAGIVALLAAIFVPARLVDLPLRRYAWLFPVGAMVVCVFLLRHLFA